MNDWCQQLGVSHRRRDEVAGDELHSLRDRGGEQDMAVRRRWPGVVAALRSLATRYNDGAGLEILSVVDAAGGENRDLTVTAVARGGQTLMLTMVGAELCVRTSPAPPGAPDEGRRWITLAASDEAIAAYALQHWLTQL
jgi:hypothetical protein